MWKKRKGIWIIEQASKYSEWEPTVGVALTRADARREKKYYWEENHPELKFRIRRYVTRGY